jgi:hypothetical protein
MTRETAKNEMSSLNMFLTWKRTFFACDDVTKNLRKLLIFTTIIAIVEHYSQNLQNANKTLSKEYLENAFSIVFRKFNYQFLQEFVQRNINLNFFESILSNIDRLRSQMITKFAAESSRNIESKNASFSNFELNKKEFIQNVITIQSTRKKIISLVFFTTSISSKQINSFVASSSLLFDFLFQQFRSSFSSDSFTSCAKFVSFNKFSAELHLDLEFSRIKKLNEQLTLEITSKITSSMNQSTNITSIMSIFDENVSSSFVFNLTQQNIQEIVLFMFNLFAQNVQDQTQTKAIEATIDIATIAKKNSFRASNVRFFDSQLNSFYDSDDVVQINRNLYYKNVYLFVKRVKDVVIMFDVEVVRINLLTCLRDSTQMWYIESLSDLKKKILRTLNEEIDHWCNALLKKFKKFVASTLNYLIIERYILNDVRANRNISSFVFQIMRQAKVANIANLHDQLTWTYNVITSELIKNIDFSDENISIMTFLKNLKTKKNIWHRIYIRKSTSSRIESEFQTKFSNSSFLIHEQSIYSLRQYFQRRSQQFENDNDSRNYQKFLF